MDNHNSSCFQYCYRTRYKFNTLPNLKLDDPISTIPLIGPKYQKILERLDIETVRDLITYFPRNYFDSSQIHSISELSRQEKKTFKAVITDFKSTRTKKRNFTIQTAIASDGDDAVEIIWFNQPFLKNSIKLNKEYIFSGKLSPKSYRPQVQSPEFEEVKEEQTHLGLITPIYPLTEGISVKWLRSRIKWILDNIDYITDLEEYLPDFIIDEYRLENIKPAVTQTHFPSELDAVKKARYRIAFDELLKIQVQIHKQRKENQGLKAEVIKLDSRIIDNLIKDFGFELTEDQKNAIKEVAEDLSSQSPMNRLLSGDVGSGKTIVAIAAALLTAKAGFQTAILAPTTVLADQHYESFTKLLEPFGVRIKLVSSNTTKKDISDADVIIGTQAILFQKSDLFSKLALVVVDEQHRFGVEQREELVKAFTDKENMTSVHLLNMTATPIPRTLALTLFGDLEVSEIKQKPKMRKPTQSYLVPEKKREDAINWIEDKAKEGVQVFWITPLIEESDKLEVASVKKTYKTLKEKLKDLNIELLHGQIKPQDKQELLENFKNFDKKQIHILVSTSVIEVGIDIPNANIIVIEGAERFGLAQLHQLRGRVGRSSQDSWCFLFTSEEPEGDLKARLEYFAQENDGFKLAEYDLQRRGPGEVYGTRQSGIPELKVANIFDLDLVKTTKDAAIKLDDDNFTNSLLK